MISDPGTPTLDQLRVFLTVVEVGSFAAAARKLHRATSVISYSIANLEMQLGVSLFDRQTTRKPQLTDAGRTVLAEARTIANGIHGLRAKVKGLLQGLEAEVHLVLDVMLPAERVVDALKSFREEFPTVALHLHMEALGAVTDRVINRGAIVGVSGPMNEGISGIEKNWRRQCRVDSGGSPESPTGLKRLECSGCGARVHSIGAVRSFAADQGQGLRRAQ